VVLGGLLQTRKFDVHRRVPIVADIPLIGDLFRYDSVAEERRELLVILTPRIIYGKEDADLVKQIESSRMSWILGDVVALHGEAGLRSRCDEWQDADIEAVYPTHVPEEGVLPLSEPRFTPFDEAMMGPDCEPVILPGPMMIPADGATMVPPNWTPVITTPAPTVVPAPTTTPLPTTTPVPLPPQDDPSQLPAPPLPPQSSFLNDEAGEPDRYGLDDSVQQAAAASTPAQLMMPTEIE
jgi:hypothetical protein